MGLGEGGGGVAVIRMGGGWVAVVVVVAATAHGAGAVDVITTAGAGTWAAVWCCGRGNDESGFRCCGHFDEAFRGNSGRHDAAAFSGVLGWFGVLGG